MDDQEQKRAGGASMTDVARLAGVSQSTVSYVINGTRPISQETRQLVEDAIRVLDYTPNAAARSLRSARSQTLALSVPAQFSPPNAGLGVYLMAIAAAAAARGYQLLVRTDGFDRAEELVRLVTGRKADAVMLLSVVAEDPRVRLLDRAGIPAVAIGEPSEPSQMRFVDYDFAGAVDLAAATLSSWGHHAALFVGPSEAEIAAGALYTRRVAEALAPAAARHGLSFVTVSACSDRVEEERRIGAVLAEMPDLSALVCMALPSFERARRLFLTARPHVDPARAVMAFGTLGTPDTPGADATRIEHPVDAIAANAVHLAEAALSKSGAPSLKLLPFLKFA
ncbi:hypothetical protein BJF93_08910 [Xaviernesmea oryzae]|uniref:LacI family transcriptional regulator n=1 Tax=Xaviernesmea oryzae TaxID=464029 RepID=A0A1Q9B144_9HYPH|nr:LacI family DNA-binding transcriptional regulator [Xaviernesmea oryzae]OLP61709.1 hypothetical protein BJF93_08910 [Xaviernesmea oryzae]SEL01608.1 transcriptional regulator, LacI family [Xaviernesmea oryzae]